MKDTGNESSGPGGMAALKDRLNRIRKRKRAFGGQAVDMEALKRRLKEQRRRGR